MTNAPSAGWYPDPFGERWWDGATWAPLIRDEGEAVEPTTVLAGSTPPGWYLDPFAERWWDGAAWTETARSRWEPGAFVAPTTVIAPPPTRVVPIVDPDAIERRRRALLVGGGVVLAIVAGVVLAFVIADRGSSAEDPVPSTSSSAPIPGATPTLPPIVTVDPAATTLPPVTIGGSTTSLWNTSIAPPTAPPPTAPPETTVAPTAPPTAAPTTAAPATPPGSVPPITVTPITVAPTTPPARGGGASATASCQAPDSYANDGAVVSFSPFNVIDGDPSTAWRCSIPATGQTVTLNLGGSKKVTQVGLIGGYTKVDPASGIDRFEENYRVKDVRWRFDDGSTVEQHLEDTRELQTMKVKATSGVVVMEVLDVYPPSFPEGNPRYRPYFAVSEIDIKAAS